MRCGGGIVYADARAYIKSSLPLESARKETMTWLRQADITILSRSQKTAEILQRNARTRNIPACSFVVAQLAIYVVLVIIFYITCKMLNVIIKKYGRARMLTRYEFLYHI